MGASCRCTKSTSQTVESHVSIKKAYSSDKINSGTSDMVESPFHFAGIRRITSKQKGAVIDSRAELSNVEVCLARITGQPQSHWETQLITLAVQRNAVLTNLPEDSREAVIWGMKQLELDANEVVFEEGKPAENFFVVTSGTLEVLVSGSRVRIVKTGDSFGERGLLNNTPRSATVRTLTKVTLWGLDRKTFREATQKVSERNYRQNMEFLKSVPLFNVMSADEKENLLAVTTPLRFRSGTHIVCEGELGDLFYLITEGTVICTVKEVEMRQMTRGDYFGEQALLYNVPRTATVTCMDQVRVLSIHREHLKEALGASLQRIIYKNTQRIVMDRCPVLRSLSTQQKERLLVHIETCSYQDGEVVISAGSRLSDALHIVVNGQLRTDKMLYADIFETVGEQELLASSSEVAETDIVAVGYTDVAAIPRETFEKVLGGTLAQVSAQNEALAALKKVSLFRNFSQPRLEELLKLLSVQSFADQELIVRQNEVGESLLIVKSGEAQVVKNGVVLRTITQHGFFGERSLLLSDVRTASVVAMGQCECWVLHQKEFVAVTDEGVSLMLMRRMELQDDSITLDDLSVVKLLGKGTFGSVHLVEHRQKKTLYALKSVHRRKINAYDQAASLQVSATQLERQLLLQIDHVFIVKLVKTFKDANRIYFLMEFVPGQDLFDVLRTLGLLKSGQSKFYAACLLLILEQLHERSIVHRDLKPDNVMVDEKVNSTQGYLKLIDFGTAKQINGRTFTIVGTPHYMAPEVVQGTGYTLSADLWSLGVMLYEFVVGSLPFGEEEEDPFAVYDKILQDPLHFPSALPKGNSTRHFIELLLNRNPALRANIPKLKDHKWFFQFQWVRDR